MRAILVLLLLTVAGCETQSTCSPEQEKTLAPEGGLKRVIENTDKICTFDGVSEDSAECREAQAALNSLMVCYYYLTR
jgi:hypothetical protein